MQPVATPSTDLKKHTQKIWFLTAIKLQANVRALEILGCVVGRIL